MTEGTLRFQPLEHLSRQACEGVRAVLTDIDDTLTENGRLPAIAYAAMEKLQHAGIIVVPVTGRPAGWCDMIARQWPVDAVVGENGAFYFRHDNKARHMSRHYMKSPEQRGRDRRKLEILQQEILSKVEGCAIASDQAYREADLAIDFAEDVHPLSTDAIDQIVEIFEAHGATAKVSSIHVNGWFGVYDKLTTSIKMLKTEFDIDAEHNRQAIVFVGDSPNDAPMFGYFQNSVGVANVMHFADRLSAKPGWVTSLSGGHGFAELVDHLLNEN